MSTNDLAIFQQIVVLIGHLAWPITVVILIYSFHSHIAKFLTVLTERAKDPKSAVSVGRDGVTITRQQAETDGQEIEIIRLSYAININENGFEQKLTDWVKKQDKDLSVVQFLVQKKYTELRKKAVVHFNLS